jgi:hypothetical protein
MGALSVGLLVWVPVLLYLPAPLAARILLLAPLVIVPRLLGLLPHRAGIHRLAGWPALMAAVPLVAAFAVPPGPFAAALTVPWLLVALVGASAAALHGLAWLPGILHPRRADELGIDVSLAFLVVGALFVTTDRLGLQPLGFSTAIILLTGVHFHFAGFALLALASLVAGSRSLLRAPVLGLVVGTPVTALGFILASDPLNALGAVMVGFSGIGVGLALISTATRGASRWAQRIAGAALLVGMPMGIAWSLAILLGTSFLDLELMVRTHGALNALAVLLAVVSLPTGRRASR